MNFYPVDDYVLPCNTLRMLVIFKMVMPLWNIYNLKNFNVSDLIYTILNRFLCHRLILQMSWISSIISAINFKKKERVMPLGNICNLEKCSDVYKMLARFLWTLYHKFIPAMSLTIRKWVPINYSWKSYALQNISYL